MTTIDKELILERAEKNMNEEVTIVLTISGKNGYSKTQTSGKSKDVGEIVERMGRYIKKDHEGFKEYLKNLK